MDVSKLAPLNGLFLYNLSLNQKEQCRNLSCRGSICTGLYMAGVERWVRQEQRTFTTAAVISKVKTRVLGLQLIIPPRLLHLLSFTFCQPPQRVINLSSSLQCSVLFQEDSLEFGKRLRVWGLNSRSSRRAGLQGHSKIFKTNRRPWAWKNTHS